MFQSNSITTTDSKSKLSRSLGWLASGLAIDLRSLAAFRIGAGTLLLLDLVLRAMNLTAFYTDEGVFPRTARIAMDSSDMYDGLARLHWSLHMLSGEVWGQVVLFVLAGLAAVCLLAGYRTRLANITSWVLFVSLQDRNPFLGDAGDTLMKCLLFWGMFLPLGATASVDALRRIQGGTGWSPKHALHFAKSCRRPRRGTPDDAGGIVRGDSGYVLSWAGAAFLLQVGVMYWCTAAEKFDPTWIEDFSAIYYALSVDMYSRPLGQQLLHYPALLRWLTIVTYWLEWLGPCLAVAPLLRGWWRAALVAVFWCWHAGTAVTMQLGVLPWIMVVGWFAFLPGVVWDVGERLVAPFRRGELARPPHVAATPPAAIQVSGAANIVAAMLLTYMLVWNVDVVADGLGHPLGLPPGFKTVAHVTRLNQTWKMFAPRPLRDDGWYVMKGKLRDGSIVNLWEPGKPLPFKKPPLVMPTYHGERWCNYLLAIWRPSGAVYRNELSQWLKRRWNAQYAQGDPQREVESLEIIFQLEETPPPGTAQSLVKTYFLWKSQYEAEWKGPGDTP
ncbi:MAG TPA: HTTM domain-containing protein [Pirellulales bacterium]|nr:HTTM domain-containing protein [Pirellulales bacterium]